MHFCNFILNLPPYSCKIVTYCQPASISVHQWLFFVDNFWLFHLKICLLIKNLPLWRFQTFFWPLISHFSCKFVYLLLQICFVFTANTNFWHKFLTFYRKILNFILVDLCPCSNLGLYFQNLWRFITNFWLSSCKSASLFPHISDIFSGSVFFLQWTLMPFWFSTILYNYKTGYGPTTLFFFFLYLKLPSGSFNPNSKALSEAFTSVSVILVISENTSGLLVKGLWSAWPQSVWTRERPDVPAWKN